MSQSAIALATRDAIRTALAVDDTVCRFMPDGKPAAFAGELWVSVHLADGEGPDDTDAGMAEYYGVLVTVTKRAAYSPADQQGEEVLVKATQGLEWAAEAIRAAVHKSYAVMNAANAIIGPAANGFIEPLKSRRPVKPRPVYADWFSAESRGGNKAALGFAVELVFFGAKRIQRKSGPQT